MTLPRTRLLARLFASEPRLVRMCAPPGYGKSSLARLFARRFDRHSMCDCVGIADTVDFAGRALAALAGESQGGGDTIAATRLRLHATEADSATWSRALLDAWKARQEHSLFALEHAEAVAENGAVLTLLGDMLASRPAERVVLISSRDAMPLRVSHYLAPHQILTLSSADLRFDYDEAAAVFEGSGLSQETVKRIVLVADGAPLVLLLLALFAQYDANIEKALERLGELPTPGLHEHLVNEVLSAFTPDMMATMLATAAIPNASLEDIAAATGIRHATPLVDRLLRLPGFISSETGAYQAHPLLYGALRARHEVDLTNYLFRAAGEYERSGDFLRAAELYRAYGDHEAAAAALDRLPATVLQQPSPRLIDALAKIKMSTLCGYPNLWIALLPHRRQNVETARLYDEALRLLQSLSPESSPSLQQRLRVRLALLAQELDQLSEANALLEASRLRDWFADAPEEQRLVLVTSAIVATKQGRFAEAERFLDLADAVQGARHVRLETERSQVAIEKARLLGEWDEVLKLSEESLYAAQRSGVTSRIVEAARAVAAAAWYCDNDARALAANQMREDCGDPEVRLSARCIESALAGEAIDAPKQLLGIALWHAALASTDVKRASELFDQAIDGSDSGETDFLRVAIRVCAALLLPAQRRRLLEARMIAQRIESAPLQASLELLIDSPEPFDYGIFRYLAARVARSPLKVRRDLLYVDTVRGQVRRGAEPLHVSDRGLELLVALALLPAGVSKEALSRAIWPGLDGEAALNTLKMSVSRTRAQLADKEAIVSTKSGYALSERVSVDVREFERLLRSVRGSGALSDPVRRQVEEAVRALGARERAYAAEWVWFAPHATHLDELQRELALALAGDEVRRAPRAPAVKAFSI